MAVREPLDLAGLAAQATGTQYTALASDPALVKKFGVRIGKQLVSGGQLLRRVHTRLLSSYDGEFGKLEGLVVMRATRAGMTANRRRARLNSSAGLIDGVGAGGVPAVGVELTAPNRRRSLGTRPKTWRAWMILDTIAGRAALAFALAGDHGAYGVKSTADALLPHRCGSLAQP